MIRRNGTAAGTAFPHARLRAALRAIAEAHRVRARGRRKLVPLTGSRGYLDALTVHGGTIRVVGWTDAPRIRLSTEAETRDIVPDAPRADVGPDLNAHGFDAVIRGARQLEILIEGETPQQLRPIRRRDAVANALQLAALLLRVPLRHGHDLAAYAFRGDHMAGERLESFLIPPLDSTGENLARSGLFHPAPTPTPDTSAPADIIVPVFNGHDDLIRCLAALRDHTDPQHRILLIDDASTDPRIAPLLAAFHDDRPRTRIVTLTENSGFVAAVNRGLAEAQGDVILLNTDAFVPANWTARLLAPLREDATVASVTPMSNNAEILSAPVTSRSGPDDPVTAVAADAVAARLNPVEARADLPTGVGFCMAMSRPWLDRFPAFDRAFGPGYGEEVDWCRRVAQAGGRHVGIGSLFVAHRGGASFGAARVDRIAAGNALIARRYPRFEAEVSDFKRSDPMAGPRLALGIAMAATNDPLPVYLAHRMGGGAARWLEAEVEGRLTDGAGVLVIRDGEAAGNATLELITPVGRTTGAVPMNDLSGYLGAAGSRDLVYSCLAGARDPLGLVAAVASTLRAGDKLTVLFHDYFPLCPSYNLIGADGRFCGLPDAAACQSCYRGLPSLTGQRPPRIADWRATWAGLVTRADAVAVFSEDTRAQVLRVWPDIAPKLTVRPHTLRRIPRTVTPSAGPVPVIGVLGAIGYPKGADVLRRIAGAAGGRAKIVVIGRIDPAYAHPGLTIHGEYRPDQIADIAEGYGVSRWFMPSIWPETFSFATRECLATGLPVLAFDLGAQAEVLRNHDLGRLIPLDTPPAAILDALLG